MSSEPIEIPKCPIFSNVYTESDESSRPLRGWQKVFKKYMQRETTARRKSMDRMRSMEYFVDKHPPQECVIGFDTNSDVGER